MSLIGAISGGIQGAIFGGIRGGWYGAAIGFVIGATIGGIAGELLKPDVQLPGAPELSALSYTSNTIGEPIADVLGTAKLTGTLLYFGGERNTAVTQEVSGGGGKGGGGSQTQTTGYRYYMSWAIGLCVGPVDELLTVFRNDEVVWSGNLVRPVSSGQETIVIPDMGSMTFFFGTDDQTAAFSLRESPIDFGLIPGLFWVGPGTGGFTVDYNMSHRGLCWTFFNDCYIGDYNRMPTMRFVLRKTPAIAFSEYPVIQDLDYNPAHAIWYILHDMVGLPETWLDPDDFEAAAATLVGESRGISMCFQSQQSALDYIESINGHIDGILRYGGDGKFHPKLIRDDYTVGSLPLIDETVVLDDPTFSRKSWIDTVNEMKVQYSEITISRAYQWYIDGVPWTGAIRTVGVDKDFTTLIAARADANATDEDCLFLIDPGTYAGGAATSPSVDTRKTYYRGLGATPEDTIIDGHNLGAFTTVFLSFIENLWIFSGSDGGEGGSLNLWHGSAPDAVSSLIANKAIIGNSQPLPGYFGYGSQWPVNGVGPYGLGDQYVSLNYTRLITTTGHSHETHIAYMVKENVYLNKVSWVGTAWADHNSVGTAYALDDKAEDGTVGYGPDYGDFRITYEGILGDGHDIKQSTADPAAADAGNVAIQGRVVSKTIQMALFTTNDNAVWAGGNNLRKESYPFAAVSFPANRNAFRLEVGDCFKFSYAQYGISNMICRVLQIAEEGPESETITIQAMEDFFSIANVITEYTTPTGHAITAPDYTVAPFTHQKIIEAPFALSSTIQLLPAACRESALDLGFEVYMSVDGGASYLFITRSQNLQPFGTLVGAYPADTYTLDDEIGFTIDFEQGAELIETASWSEVFAGIRNVALLGDEIISFQSITPVTGTQYKLEGIIRGRYDTQKQDHAEGAEFYAITSASMTLISNSEIVTGAARKFKFVPYNIKTSGLIAEAAALDLTIAGRALTPYMPGNLCANGSNTAARYDTDIVLTWSPRYRGKGAGIGLPGTVLADADREGLFKVEVYVTAALVRTTDTVGAATWTYTEVMNIADNGSPAASVTFKVSNYRTSGGNTYESDQAEVICKKN